MARAARAALADQRALEEEAERTNPLDGRVSGGSATPSMGLSEHRGGGKLTITHGGGHRDGAGHMTGAGREGKMLYDHLSGLHGKGFADSFFKGALGSTLGSKIMGRGASETGQFQGEGHMTGAGHCVGAGDMAEMADKAAEFVLTTKAQARAAIKKIMKAMPEKVAEGKAFLEKLAGKGRMCGAGWFGDMVDWIARYVNPNVADFAKAARANKNLPGRRIPSKLPDVELQAVAPTLTTGLSDAAKAAMSRGTADEREAGVKSAASSLLDAARGFNRRARSNDPIYIRGQQKTGKGKAKRVVSAGDGRRSRAEIVKKVMAEKGLPMIEASKWVKAHNLY